MHIYTHVHMHTHMHTCTHVHMHTHAHTHMCTHTHTHACTHTPHTTQTTHAHSTGSTNTFKNSLDKASEMWRQNEIPHYYYPEQAGRGESSQSYLELYLKELIAPHVPGIKHHKRLTLLVIGTWWHTHQRGSDDNPGADTPMLEITDKEHCQSNSVLLQLLQVQMTTQFRGKKHHLPVLLTQQPKRHFSIGEKTLKI